MNQQYKSRLNLNWIQELLHYLHCSEEDSSFDLDYWLVSYKLCPLCKQAQIKSKQNKNVLNDVIDYII